MRCRVAALFALAAIATQARAQEAVRLTLNLMPGGAASRVVTGVIKGEWRSPEPLPVKLEVRVSSYIVVSQVLSNGDAVITVQPQGFQLKGTVGDAPLEWVITADGDLRACWRDRTFDSRQLPQEARTPLRKALTAAYEVTISPQGAIKSVKAPESVKADIWKEVPPEPKLAHKIAQALLQTLWLPLLPNEPVKVGNRWSVNVPLAMFEDETSFPLPLNCTFARTEGDEAHIAVQGELKGEGAELALKRVHVSDPKVTVQRGQLQLSGEVVFVLSLGVPQRAHWKLSGEVAGAVTPAEGTPQTFSFRFEADFNDQLLF
ncbi:hypothetical protein HRbin17_02058 [bacterium HR17]|uniref:Uncharacterized protein n=1 Tax=Candidatus Fervidibacter japonicus TaxID=2035412 RepID=A0A2H5XEB6_9BACT|nr:hypothetical protein HRbin17_02058 [bacterium HR17]